MSAVETIPHRTGSGTAATPTRAPSSGTAPSRGSSSPRSSPLRDARPRLTPRACRRRATAAPMPRLAPVITAVLPSRLMASPEVAVPGRAHGSARSSRGRRPPMPAPARSARRRGRTARPPRRRRRRRRPHAGEQRRAERRAGVALRALERQVEHRGDDRRPEVAARAAAGDPPDRRAHARARASELEGVAQPVGDALHRRARERAPVVPEREPGERPARVGIGVRRALAGEVRREQQPLRAGRQRAGLAVELPAARPPSSSADPGERAAAATASRPSRATCPGTAWQNV